MRWVVLALTTMIVVLVAVAWQRGERVRTPARAPGATRPAEVAPVRPAPHRRPAEDVAEAPEPRPITLRFTVGFFGSERAVERVRATVWALDRDAEAFPVTTDDGTFEITLPEPGRYLLGDIEIDGEEIPDYSKDLLVTKSTAIEIRVPEARDVTLVVVDAKDHRPLAGAQVYDYGGAAGWGFGFEHWNRPPGPETLAGKLRRTDRAGRLPLGKGRGAAALYLFAEGHAWTAVSVPFDAGDEIVVELEPGGRVRLLVPGWNELREPRIFARRVMTTDDFPVPPLGEDEELLLDGLLGDDYVFTVRRSKPGRDGKVYGTGEVSVRAGQTVELTLHVAPESAVSSVRVTGTLTVPATWIEPPARITLEGVDKANAEIDEAVWFDSRPYRFETRPIPPGRYLAVVMPYLWSERATVSDRGGHFDFDLPHPVTLRVVVVDVATGRRIPDATLSCRVPAARGGESAGPPVENGLFVFQVVPGTVRLQPSASEYCGGETTIAAQQDRDVTIQMHKAGIVVVRLRLDGRPFDGAGVYVTVEASVLWSARGFDGGVARFDELEPGNYHFKLGDVAGCAAVPAQRVELKAGRTHEVVFELERNPVPKEAER